MPTEEERAVAYLADQAHRERMRQARAAALAAPPENAQGLWERTKALLGHWPTSDG